MLCSWVPLATCLWGLQSGGYCRGAIGDSVLQYDVEVVVH